MAYSDRRPGLGVVVVVATLVLSLLWQAGPAYAVAGNIVGSLTDGANDPPPNVTWSLACATANPSYPTWRAFDNLMTTHARCTSGNPGAAGQIAVNATFSGGYTPTITAARAAFWSIQPTAWLRLQFRCGVTAPFVAHDVTLTGVSWNFDGIDGFIFDTGVVTVFNTAPCLSTDRIQFYNHSASSWGNCANDYRCAWLEAEAYAVDPETPPSGSMAAISLSQWSGSTWLPNSSSPTWRPNDGAAEFFAQFYDDVDCHDEGLEWWWQVRRVDVPATVHDEGTFDVPELGNYNPYEDPDPPNNPDPPAEHCYIAGASAPGGTSGTALIIGPLIVIQTLYGGRYFVDVGPRVGGVNMGRLGRGYFTLYDNSQAVGWRAVVPDVEGKLPIAAEEQCGLDIPCWLRSIWRAIIGLSFPEVVFPDFEWPEIEVPGFEVDYEPLIALLVGDAGPVEDGIVELFGGLESREPFYSVLAARERVLGTVESLADENTEASGACPTFMVGPFVFPEVEPQTYALELCFSDWGSSEAYRQVRALMGGVVWFGFALGLWRRFAPTLY